MHEYGLASHIAEEAFQRAGGKRLVGLRLAVGALAGHVAEPVLMYLCLALEEKGMNHVKIETRLVAAECHCDCGTDYRVTKVSQTCPSCGSQVRRIAPGRDCVLEAVETG